METRTLVPRGIGVGFLITRGKAPGGLAGSRIQKVGK